MASPGCEWGTREGSCDNQNEFPVPETTGNYLTRRGHDQIPTDSVPWKRLLDFMQMNVVCTAVYNPPFKNPPAKVPITT